MKWASSSLEQGKEGQSLAWYRPGEKIKTERPVEDVKLNCWAGISYRGATSLQIFRENLRATVYQPILERHMPEMQELYPDGYSFIHDNHQAHAAVEAWMRNNHLEQEPFPSYSPDLNIIENLWSALKDRVAGDAPRTENQLVNSLRRNWEILTTSENLQSYFHSLHTRYLECIEEDGARLPY